MDSHESRPATTSAQQGLRDDHLTFFNLGMCSFDLGDLATARTMFEKTLELNPSYHAAENWLLQVEGAAQDGDQAEGAA